MKNAIEKAASFGEIRGVVSCAGIYTEGLLDNVTDEEMQKFFEVNVFGTIKLLRAAVPFLRMHGGSIVTVASDAAIQGNVQCSLYSATKGAVTAFENCRCERNRAGDCLPYFRKVFLYDRCGYSC